MKIRAAAEWYHHLLGLFVIIQTTAFCVVQCESYENEYERIKLRTVPSSRTGANDAFDNYYGVLPYSAPYQVRSSALRHISPEPEITKSQDYVAPSESQFAKVSRHRRRPQEEDEGDKYDYVKNYNDFVFKNFDTRFAQYKEQLPKITEKTKEDFKRDDRHERDDDHEGGGGGGGGGGNGRTHASLKNHPSSDSGSGPSYSPSSPQPNREYETFDKFQPSIEYERIKMQSEQQAKEIEKNPGNCKIERRDDMDCRVCHDSKTGAKSESCAFSSKPEAKKYAYAKERKFNTDDPKGNKEFANGDAPPPAPPSPEKLQQLRAHPSSHAPAKLVAAPADAGRRADVKKYHARYRTGSERRPQRDTMSYLRDIESHRDRAREPERGFNFDDHYGHLFPKSEQLRADDRSKPYEFLPNYDSPRDVDRVLAEFNTKDRSSCEKSTKGDLTCFLCKDAFKVEHEECMYVSDAAPKTSHLSYESAQDHRDPFRNFNHNSAYSSPLSSRHTHTHSSYDSSREASNIVPSINGSLLSESIAGAQPTEKAAVATAAAAATSAASTSASANPIASDDKTESPSTPQRRVVVKKRRATAAVAKVEPETKAESISTALPRPEDIDDNRSNEKRTIKRTVSWKLHSGTGKNVASDEPKTTYYERYVESHSSK